MQAARKIIRIDETKCNGCGHCVTVCSEGALAIVDGKARLVKELFCDGFGDCLGECPTGALTIETRAAPAYDPGATRRHLGESQDAEALRRFDAAAAAHARGSAPSHAHGGGCPGSRMRTWTAEGNAAAAAGPAPASELRQWPVQIHLVAPDAPFFRGRELVLFSTCAPIASAEVHQRWMRGRAVLVGCPKLDRTEGYVEKLAAILSEPTIPRLIVVRMSVPCCGGLTRIAHEAARLSGRSDLIVEEVTVGIEGAVAG